MALLIIGLVLYIAGLVYFFIRLRKFVKEKEPGKASRKVEGNNKILFLVLALGLGIFSIISSAGIVVKNELTLKVWEWILLVLGSYLFGSGISVAIGGFYLHYYCLDLEEKQKKYCKFAAIFPAILALIGLFLFTEGIGHHDIYPLKNRIDFVYGIVTCTKPNPNLISAYGIQFYGIIIVCGALVCYFITDHYAYKEYGEHGLIDTLFIVAFLAGIAGARLWYCLVLEPEEFVHEPIKIITEMMNGGLAIQGGALFGILFGVLFVLIFRKYMSVRFLMDVAIPTILIAQAIGRWGNFLNQEVYGNAAPAWLVSITPAIIKGNLFIDGEYKVPLFFIESIINLGGFFFIRYFLGKVCKFGIGRGYQSASYLVWYGLVRVLLEPLRNGYDVAFETSKFGYQQSYIMGWVMFGLGVLLFAVLAFIHKYRMAKGLEDKNGKKIVKA